MAGRDERPSLKPATALERGGLGEQVTRTTPKNVNDSGPFTHGFGGGVNVGDLHRREKEKYYLIKRKTKKKKERDNTIVRRKGKKKALHQKKEVGIWNSNKRNKVRTPPRGEAVKKKSATNLHYLMAVFTAPDRRPRRRKKAHSALLIIKKRSKKNKRRGESNRYEKKDFSLVGGVGVRFC